MTDHTDAPLVISDRDHEPEAPVAPPAVATVITTPAAPAATAEAPSVEAPVVLAPVSHGRSFVLRNFFNAQLQVGQMLVLAHRHMRDAAIEVLETYFPHMEPGRTFGKGQNRFYMGDRKIPNDYWPLIFEMKVSKNATGQKLFEYRLLYPSGKTLRKWSPLDLGVLKLKTTEEQRALISAFTGIVYKIRQTEAAKQTHNPDRSRGKPFKPHNQPPRPQNRMGGIFERAGVKVGEVKHKIQETKTHAPIRSDLQRGLQPTPPPEAVLPAGKDLPPADPKPAASGDVADHGISA